MSIRPETSVHILVMSYTLSELVWYGMVFIFRIKIQVQFTIEIHTSF